MWSIVVYYFEEKTKQQKTGQMQPFHFTEKMDENWPQLAMINWFGLWPGNGLKGTLEGAYSSFIMVSSLFLFADEIYRTVGDMGSGNFDVTMQHLNELFSGLQFYLSALQLILFRKELKRTLELIDGLNKEIIKKVGVVAMKEVKKRKDFGKKMFNFFLLTFFMLVIPWSSLGVLKTISLGKRVLTVDVWVPVDLEYLPIYIILYLFQLLLCWNYCLSVSMFSSLFVSICEQIFGHLQILRHTFENIKYGLPTTVNDLKSSIKHHNDILQIVYTFQQLTKFILVADFIFTMILLCSILLDIVTNASAGSWERIISLISEAYMVLTFFGAFCWYGSEITFQCDQVMPSCYLSDWYNGTTCEKKLLLTAMTRTRKPVYYGDLIRMDTLTFINVLKGAFSYYNVLIAQHTN